MTPTGVGLRVMRFRMSNDLMSPILNHIISFANVGNIDSYLEKWKRAGFVVGKKTVRHDPGLRNGFVYFGPEYIEFSWVEDEKLFRKGAEKYRKDIRRRPSPYGVAFESKNVTAMHFQLRRRGYKVPPVYSRGPRDADKSVIWWTFQSIPFRFLLGAWTFVLTYEFRKNQRGPRVASIGRNTLYAVSGLTFVTSNPQRRAEAWRNFLSPRSKLQKISSEIYQFELGPHLLEWMTPGAYSKEYSVRRIALGGSKNFREVALIHLFAANLSKAKSILKQNKFKVRNHRTRLLVGSQESDGFTFAVTEKSPKIWQRERARFGQKFVINYR